jgi:bifunctional DNase/RNase
MARLVEMVIESVRVHMLSNRHVVILKDHEGDRYLPIWIGAWEASAIAMRLQGLAAERPLTHDLFASTLEQLGVRVERVVISELTDETYHARIFMERDGTEVEVDARPSDALALAVRAEVQIFAAEEVLAQAALSADPDEAAADEEDEGAEADTAAEGETESAGRSRRRRAPIESVGNQPADPRLDMFRDFVNSLEVDPGAGGGESGGSSRS